MIGPKCQRKLCLHAATEQILKRHISRALLGALVPLMLTISAPKANASATFIGPNMMCSRFITEFYNNDLVIGYIQGYMSGYSFMLYVQSNRKYDLLKDMPPMGLVGLVRDYCSKNPNNTVLNGVNHVMIFLKDYKGPKR